MRPSDLARILWSSAAMGSRDGSSSLVGAVAADDIDVLASATAACLHRMSPGEAAASLWALTTLHLHRTEERRDEGAPAEAAMQPKRVVAAGSAEEGYALRPSTLKALGQSLSMRIPGYLAAASGGGSSTASAGLISQIAWSAASLRLSLPEHEWHGMIAWASSESFSREAQGPEDASRPDCCSLVVEAARWTYVAARGLVGSLPSPSSRPDSPPRLDSLPQGRIGAESAGARFLPDRARQRASARSLLSSRLLPHLLSCPPDVLDAPLLVDALWGLSKLRVNPDPRWLLAACRHLAVHLLALPPPILVRLCQATAHFLHQLPLAKGAGDEAEVPPPAAPPQLMPSAAVAGGPIVDPAATNWKEIGPLSGLKRPVFLGQISSTLYFVAGDDERVAMRRLLSAAASAAVGSPPRQWSRISASDASALLWALQSAGAPLPSGQLARLSACVHSGFVRHALPPSCLARACMAVAGEWAAASVSTSVDEPQGRLDLSSAPLIHVMSPCGIHESRPKPQSLLPWQSLVYISPDMARGSIRPQPPKLLEAIGSLADPSKNELLSVMTADELTMVLRGVSKAAGRLPSESWKKCFVSLIKVRCMMP